MANQMIMPTQINIRPWEHPYHKCEHCGSVSFESGLIVKEASGIEIGRWVPLIMEVVRCSKCLVPALAVTPNGIVDFKEIVKKELEYGQNDKDQN